MVKISGRTTQRGNIILGLFGAIGLVATIGVLSMGVVKGPVRGIDSINDRTATQNAAMAAVQIIAQESVAQEKADCDEDGYVEPIPFRDAGSLIAPVGGGHVPMSVGAAKTDGWKNPFGYCAWDPGEKTVSSNVAACGGASAKRLNGGGADEPAGIVIAVISAGSDGIFQSSCVDWSSSTAATINTPSNSDDIVRTISYAEFMVAGKGDAKLKELPDDACTAQSIGIMRLYMGIVQVCVDTGWEEVGTSAQVSGEFIPVLGAELSSTHTSNEIEFSGFLNQKNITVTGGAILRVNGADRSLPTTIVSGDKISLRATASATPEQTKTFSVSVGGVKKSWTIRTRDFYPPYLVITPSSAEPPTVTTLNVQGPANPSYGSVMSFEVKNTGEVASNALSAAVLSNTTNFEFYPDTATGDDCHTKILQPNESCVIDIRSKATSTDDQTTITTSLTVSDGARTASSTPLRGFAKGWTCESPWGGPRINHAANITAYNITAASTCNGTCTSQVRTCTGDVLGGSASYQYQTCNQLAACSFSWDATEWNTCSATPSWTTWGSWGGCSTSCGPGTQSRTRTCQNTGGTQARTVRCKRSDGTFVDDSLCSGAGAKPVDTQTCTGSCTGAASESQACGSWTYAYAGWGGWGGCSASCGGGAQYAYRGCNRCDGAAVDCSYCGGACATSQSCNNHSCEMYNNPYVSNYDGVPYCGPGVYYYGCHPSDTGNPYDKPWVGTACWNGTAVGYSCSRFTIPPAASFSSGGYTYIRGTHRHTANYGGVSYGIQRVP